MRNTAKSQITLFFIEGPVPSADELAAALALGTKCFRNAKHSSTPPKDGCKAAGKVPENYRCSKSVTIVQVPQSAQGQQQTKK